MQVRTLAGMMELLPSDQLIFNHIKNIIEKTFVEYGFYPLDTPAMESTDVLYAKGGGETSKQVYEIKSSKNDKALRFDLTVPLAKYCALYFQDLNFPFRRYHIGKVFRGERNQKGRYREFYQADIDIIGHNTLSLYNDAEVIRVMAEIFELLNLDYTFHINNRKLLNGFLDYIKVEEKTEVLRIIDKLSKIGQQEVSRLLIDLGMTEKQVEQLFLFLESESFDIDHEEYREGKKELDDLMENLSVLGVKKSRIKIDRSITRGLDYYTGIVLETFLNDHYEVGSICSGGRYDNLAENFTSQSLPGVGLSIGLTRLFYILKSENLLAAFQDHLYDFVIIPMKGCERHALSVLSALRQAGKKGFAYMENGKMGKKFTFCDKEKVPYVIIIGEEEMQSQKYSLRDMSTGEQEAMTLDKIIERV